MRSTWSAAPELHPLVLRRYVRGEGPEAPRREAAALEGRRARRAHPTPGRGRAPRRRAPRRFIHRDYHPGNGLWRGGAISGIVDWASASVGAPVADVGHCRVNLDPAAADRFLAAWRSIAGRDDYDFWASSPARRLRAVRLDRFDAADTAFLLRAVSRL